MKLSFLKSLIQLVESSNVEEIEITRWWTKVRITKSRPNPDSRRDNGAIVVEVPRPAEEKPAATVAAQAAQAQQDLVEIKSPMVGTFYRAPSPGAKPYVDVGEMLQSGQVVCIIEAMKLMNEIESSVAGRLVKVLVENGQPVEYGQPLFLVSPS
ncbi:MAG TPA: acetyl-CoA carboxylase biotin carboxyl carrier protein [bacterium]|nr:acetyl-CoA carboxylase biotin carboxyl carrier protein [bacterium]